MHRVVHVHAKDIDEAVLERMQTGELDYESAVGAGLYCNLGVGMVDWDGFRDSLQHGGYTGWVVAEQDRLLLPDSRDPYDSNHRNAMFLRALLGIES
jgi:inosose dehydratase